MYERRGKSFLAACILALCLGCRAETQMSPDVVGCYAPSIGPGPDPFDGVGWIMLDSAQASSERRAFPVRVSDPNQEIVEFRAWWTPISADSVEVRWADFHGLGASYRLLAGSEGLQGVGELPGGTVDPSGNIQPGAPPRRWSVTAARVSCDGLGREVPGP